MSITSQIFAQSNIGISSPGTPGTTDGMPVPNQTFAAAPDSISTMTHAPTSGYGRVTPPESVQPRSDRSELYALTAIGGITLFGAGGLIYLATRSGKHSPSAGSDSKFHSSIDALHSTLPPKGRGSKPVPAESTPIPSGKVKPADPPPKTVPPNAIAAPLPAAGPRPGEEHSANIPTEGSGTSRTDDRSRAAASVDTPLDQGIETTEPNPTTGMSEADIVDDHRDGTDSSNIPIEVPNTPHTDVRSRTTASIDTPSEDVEPTEPNDTIGMPEADTTESGSHVADSSEAPSDEDIEPIEHNADSSEPTFHPMWGYNKEFTAGVQAPNRAIHESLKLNAKEVTLYKRLNAAFMDPNLKEHDDQTRIAAFRWALRNLDEVIDLAGISRETEPGYIADVYARKIVDHKYLSFEELDAQVKLRSYNSGAFGPIHYRLKSLIRLHQSEKLTSLKPLKRSGSTRTNYFDPAVAECISTQVQMPMHHAEKIASVAEHPHNLTDAWYGNQVQGVRNGIKQPPRPCK